MRRIGIQRLAGGLYRELGWKRWALTSACMVILACTGTSSGPANSQLQSSNEWRQSTIERQGPALVFVPASASSVELQGTATIGSWKSHTADIRGQVILDTDAGSLAALFDRIESARPGGDGSARISLLNLPLRSPPTAEISVPIMSLHGDSSGMDRDMQTALKAAQHPRIDYVFQQMQQADLQWDAAEPRASLELRVTGTLSMAGVERPIAMDVIVKRDARGHFHARAQADLLMTDFGVTPPVALLGLIKAGNQVHVVFDLDLVPVSHLTGASPTDLGESGESYR